MSLGLIVRRSAEHEATEVALWYETRQPGSGRSFLRSMDAAIALIVRHPQAGPVQFGAFRRILISRYPYGVFYVVEATRIVVHAVFHTSRDRKKLQKRLESETDEPPTDA
jgi:plasmid stabilization system protein ParE